MGRADAGGDVSRAGERPVRVRSPALLAPCLLRKFTESVASCFQTVWRPRAREQGSDGVFPPWASFGCSCCWELLFARSHCDYSTQWRGWRYEQRVPLLGRPASLRPSASAQEEPAPPPGAAGWSIPAGLPSERSALQTCAVARVSQSSSRGSFLILAMYFHPTQGNPLQYSAWRFHGQRSLMGSSPWGHKESDMTEQFTLSHYFGSFGKKSSHLLSTYNMPGASFPAILTFMLHSNPGRLRV